MKRLTVILSIVAIVISTASALFAVDLSPAPQGLLAELKPLPDADLAQIRGKFITNRAPFQPDSGSLRGFDEPILIWQDTISNIQRIKTRTVQRIDTIRQRVRTSLSALLIPGIQNTRPGTP